MRDEKLDFFKGLLIWSVILGHCLNILTPHENMLHIILRTIDLPLFMYISGFLIRGSLVRHSLLQLILNKICGIVVPAIIWMFISLLFNDHCVYYFLWAVFISSLIVSISEFFLKNSSLIIIVYLTIIIVLHLIPYNIFNLSFLFPFFVLGACTYEITKIKWYKGILSSLIYVLLVMFVWNPSYSIWNAGSFLLTDIMYMIKVVTIRFVIGLLGLYMFIWIVGKLYDDFKNNFLVTTFAAIGKETLSLYLLQHVIVEIIFSQLIIKMDISSLINNYKVLFGYIMSPIVSLILLVVMYYMIVGVKKNKYIKWIFGFKLNIHRH